MTLGGLALAVGMLVDEATVTIENIERHLHMGTDLHEAIIEGAGEIARAGFVSTLCICIVFVPMFFLSGVARFLFVPLAEAVVFAMAASYMLSRTLVPTLVMLLMGMASMHESCRAAEAQPAEALNHRLRRRFEQVRGGYTIAVGAALAPAQLLRRLPGVLPAVVRPGSSCWAATSSPRSTGQIRLHMRMPTGTRIEETARSPPTRSRR
jgi:multidrug efflux pump subunit AcrB